MLARLPIVASDVGSVSEAIVDGESGLLMRPDGPRALSAAVQRLLTDRTRAKELGRKAREHALQRFTATATARTYASLYAEAVS